MEGVLRGRQQVQSAWGVLEVDSKGRGQGKSVDTSVEKDLKKDKRCANHRVAILQQTDVFVFVSEPSLYLNHQHNLMTVGL